MVRHLNYRVLGEAKPAKLGLNIDYCLFIGPLVSDLLFKNPLLYLLLALELTKRLLILVYGLA